MKGIFKKISEYLYKALKTVTVEELAVQRFLIAKKEAEIKHIYWQISEIERLSKEKTKAIQSGNMVLYERLCEENDLLRQGFKN